MCCVKPSCSIPKREPYLPCDDRKQGYEDVYIHPDAMILLAKYGISPCDVPRSPDNEVRRQGVVVYLQSNGYIS